MPRFAANLSFLFQDRPFLERFGAARQAGFEAVEFMFPTDQAPASIAARLREHGLQAVLMNMPAGNWEAGERGLAALPERRQDFRAALQKGLDVAITIECPRLHVLAGQQPAGTDRRAFEACYTDNLAWASGPAAQADVTLTIEPINRRDIPDYFLHDYDHAERLLRGMDLPNLRLQFDIYHAQVIHGDVSHRLAHQMPLIEHVQIANPPGRNEPGQGELDFGFLFQKLDGLGYAGWIGAEYRPLESTEKSLGWLAPYRA